MIKIEYVDTYGWEAATRGMRNPMNSWSNGDSSWRASLVPDMIAVDREANFSYTIGPNDQKLMKSLSVKGPVHGKFKRMITITCDITAPLYWWKEFDTYKVGTVANSCSTMHKIQEKTFTKDDFSCEHLRTLCDLDVDESGDRPKPIGAVFCNEGYLSPLGCLNNIIDLLNCYRDLYLKTSDKKYWWQMIQLLPSSYNQKRTVQMNYEVLTNIYANRRDHKLDEWREFCKFIKDRLPFSFLFTGEEE